MGRQVRTNTTLLFSILVLAAACGQAPDQEQPAELIADAETASEIHQGYSETAPQYEVDGFVVSNVDIDAWLWNPRGKTDEQLAERAQFLTDASATRTPEEMEADKAYLERYKDAIVINSLMPTTVGIIGNTVESFTAAGERNRKAGVTHFSSSVGAFHPEEVMFTFVADTDLVIEQLGVTKARTTQDIRDAKAEGRMTIMYNSQGFDYELDHLGYVEKLHDSGVNIMNFVYNTENHFATGINFNENPNNTKGITELGQEFIAMANELGVIVDVSHSSDATAIDAAKYSTKPILASHNNSSVVYPMPRNMSDAGILAVGGTGGAVCVNGVGVFLSEDANARAETMAKHIQHIAGLIGKEGTCYACMKRIGTSRAALANGCFWPLAASQLLNC